MKQRMVWIDTLRVLAALAVVWLHVAVGVVQDHPSAASVSWWIGNVADSMSRWCVPIFVMITGYLLLSRPGDSLKKFYARRFSRIIIPLVFWTMFYLGLTFLLSQPSITAAVKSIIAGTPLLDRSTIAAAAQSVIAGTPFFTCGISICCWACI